MVILMGEPKIVEQGIQGKFDYLEHTADVYILAYGGDLIELFENAGLSLFETMTNTRDLELSIERRIHAEGFDLESLLYRWLEELLFLYYSENIMCKEVYVENLCVKREDGDRVYSIDGVCRGECFNPNRHVSKVEVKAVTYHLMKIVKDEEKWRAYFVLDI